MTQNLIGLHLNRTNLETLRIWLCQLSKEKDLTVKLSFYTTETQKKVHCFKTGGLSAHCNTVFEAMCCFYHYCPCQEARLSLIEEDVERGYKKEEMDQMRNSTSNKKDILLLKCGNVNGGISIGRQRVLKNT